jgi:site-specific DNA-methyltransferase (adenine-specific)
MANKKGGYKDWMIQNGGIAHYNPSGKNLPNVWLIGTEPSKELHFSRFPTALCEVPILASCPKDGIVLDPFCGSGTALQVAQRLGRKWVGIELNENYIKIANKKLAQQTLNL